MAFGKGVENPRCGRVMVVAAQGSACDAAMVFSGWRAHNRHVPPAIESSSLSLTAAS